MCSNICNIEQDSAPAFLDLYDTAIELDMCSLLRKGFSINYPVVNYRSQSKLLVIRLLFSNFTFY